jgi:amidase/aspartyl-tRNA(Asn)/glutamyl-tRNA(Gln) amidotransferase subunit A
LPETVDAPLDFSAWHSLAPGEAARELRRRAARLSPMQQRAVFASLDDEERLTAAFATTDRAKPLGGVPFLVKDVFDQAGKPTFAGSTFLPEVRPTPQHNGAFVRDVRAAGGVCAGKTHLHEFAFGITGENPHYGDCEHPRFPGHTSGGSSSGSAAAVAAGIVPLALGTDTGGSIRVPAAFCGLFGLRLTPHHPWITDAMPLAPSYDTAGWFTANAADMQTAMQALLGARATAGTPRGCALVLPGLDAEVADAFTAMAERLAPPADNATRDELLAAFAGAAGIYAVLGARETWQVHASWAERYREHYDPVVWQRLAAARALTAEAIDETEARCARLQAAWKDYFKVHDFLVLPASPCGAPTKVACNQANRTRILDLTAPVTLAGLPALALPVFLKDGRSTALQVAVQDPAGTVLPAVLSRWAGSL